MRTYTKSFKCSDVFPASPGESWNIRDGEGKVVERWTVIRGAHHGSFAVHIAEFVPEDHS